VTNRTNAFLQVLLREARKDLLVNLVLAECRVRGHASAATPDVHGLPSSLAGAIIPQQKQPV
jgi:hypothetical protein